MSEIKSKDIELLNKFFATKPIILNEKLKYLVGTRDRGFFIEISEEDNYLRASIELNDFPKDILKDFEEEIRKEGLEVSYKIDGVLTIIMNYIEDHSIVKFLSIIKILLRTLLKLKPNYTWHKWGEILVNAFGFDVTILSRDYNDPVRTGWRGDIIVILPDESGWMKSSIGLDNESLPILSYIKDEVFSYIPWEDNSLRPISLTRILEKIKLLTENVNMPVLQPPRDEAELLKNINNILGALEMIKLSVKGGMPLISTSDINSPLDELIDEIERELKLIQRMLTFDGILRMKIAIKQAIEIAREIIEGKRNQGIIVSNIRKVTKLGGGKAIYIGKEELKVIELGDRVLVKVIEEMGRKKLIIEPM